jgi:hypothetical protein
MSCTHLTPDSVLDECDPIIKGEMDEALDEISDSSRIGMAIHATWRRMSRSASYRNMSPEGLDAFCQFLTQRLDIAIPKWWSHGLITHQIGQGREAWRARKCDDQLNEADISVCGDSLRIRCERTESFLRLADLMGSRRTGWQYNPLSDRLYVCEYDGSLVAVFTSVRHIAIEYVIVSIAREVERVAWRHVVPKCVVYTYGKTTCPICSVVAGTREYVCVFGAATFGSEYVIGVFQRNGDCLCIFSTEMYEHEHPHRLDPLEWGAPEYT